MRVGTAVVAVGCELTGVRVAVGRGPLVNGGKVGSSPPHAPNPKANTRDAMATTMTRIHRFFIIYLRLSQLQTTPRPIQHTVMLGCAFVNAN